MGPATASNARASAGFTIVELLVAVGILTMSVGLVGSGMFQALSVERSWSDNVLATKGLRHAGSWFSSDAFNARTTDLFDGAPPSGEVSLSWSDAESSSHTVRYQVSGDNLVRTFDGVETVVARQVTSAAFSLAGQVLTLDLEVEAAQGSTETMSHRSYLRMLGQ